MIDLYLLNLVQFGRLNLYDDDVTLMMCIDEDDDEWTQVSTSQLQHTDTAIADTADTQRDVIIQHGQEAVKPSDDSQTASADMSSSVTSPSSNCNDTHDSERVNEQMPAAAAAAAAAELCGSDVTGAPADSLVTPAGVSSEPGTDHDSVASSDQTKSDSLVVVAVTPERTSPSDESSNAKGRFVSVLSSIHITCLHHPS